MPPKKRKAGKTAKQRGQENDDNIWNEFYAQLIEYGLEHDTYQVPVEYEVQTDDGRTLKLGLWLQQQGENLLKYSKTHPHWYNDLADLLETGKLWFDVERERTPTPTTTARASSASAQSPRSGYAQPSAVLKKDYAINDSSDEDSASSAEQRQKKTLRSTFRVDTSGKAVSSATTNSAAVRESSQTAPHRAATRSRASPPPFPTPGLSAKKSSATQSKVTESELSVTSSDEETFLADLAASRAGKAGRAAPSQSAAVSSVYQKWSGSAPSAATAASVTRAASPTGRAQQRAAEATVVSPRSAASSQDRSRGLATSSSAFEAASRRAASPTSSSAALNKGAFKSLSHAAIPPIKTDRHSASSSRSATPVTPSLSRVSPVATRGAEVAPRGKRSLENTILHAQQAATSGASRAHDLYSVGGTTQLPLPSASPTPSKGIQRKELSRENDGHRPPRRTLFLRRELPPNKPIATDLPEPMSHTSSSAKPPPGPNTSASKRSASPVSASSGSGSLLSGSSSLHRNNGDAFDNGGVGRQDPDDQVPKSDVGEEAENEDTKSEERTPLSPPRQDESAEPASPHQDAPVETLGAVVTSAQESFHEAMDVDDDAPAQQINGDERATASVPGSGKGHEPEPLQASSVDSTSDDAVSPSAVAAPQVTAPAAASVESAADVTAVTAVTVYSPDLQAPPLHIRSVSDGAGSGNEKSGLSSFPSPQGSYSGVDVSTRRRSIRENKLCTDLTGDTPESLIPEDAERFADESKDSPRAPGSLSSASSDHGDLPQGVELVMIEPDEEEDLVIIAGRRGGRGVVWLESQSTQERSQGMSPAPGKRSPTPLADSHAGESAHQTTDDAPGVAAAPARTSAAPLPVSEQPQQQDRAPRQAAAEPSDAPVTASTRDSAMSPQSPTDVPMVSQASPPPAPSAEISSPQRARPSSKSRAWKADEVRAPKDDGRKLTGRTVSHEPAQDARPHRRAEREEPPPPPPQQKEAAPEFVAFAYTRGADSRRPMLGIGMVCNDEQEAAGDSLFLVVMVPKDGDLVKTEYMLDFQENITVHSNVVLARGLSFEHGHRGGVFSAASQDKIADILRTYTNLQPDRNFV